MLRILILFVLFFANIASANEQLNVTTYSLTNHPKARKLDASVDYPSTWVASEGQHEHIVQMFYDNTQPLLKRHCGVAVGFAFSNLSPQQIKEIIDSNSFNFEDYVPKNSTLLHAQKVSYKDHPGFLIEYTTKLYKQGVPFTSKTVAHNIFYRDNLIQLLCSVTGLSIDEDEIYKMFSSSKTIFDNFGNSLVINEKEELPVELEQDNQQSTVTYHPVDALFEPTADKKMAIFILLSGLFYTWGIGLFIPYFIRRKLVKKPLKEPMATIVAITQGIIMVIISELLGNHGKHFALVLVALAARAILKQGNKLKKEKRGGKK